MRYPKGILAMLVIPVAAMIRAPPCGRAWHSLIGFAHRTEWMRYLRARMPLRRNPRSLTGDGCGSFAAGDDRDYGAAARQPLGSITR